MTMLNPAQFGGHQGEGDAWGEHPYHGTQRWVRAKNGTPYRLQQMSNGIIAAHTVTPGSADFNRAPTRQSAIGSLSFFGGKPQHDGSNTDGGVIYKTIVRPRHQRRGVATAMLEFARHLNPEADVRHSNALSEEGAAWARATPTPNDLRSKKKDNI
jgi:GNAT superfamily N-acetyltransferase